MEAADALVAGTATVLLAADVHLCRRGRKLVTDTLRMPPVTAALVYVTLHVLDLLGPFDLFRAAGRRIAHTKESR